MTKKSREKQMRVFSLLLLFVVGSVNALQLSVPPLKPQDILIESISKFDDEVIIRTIAWNHEQKVTYKFWKLNHTKKTIEPFIDKKQNEVVAVFTDHKNIQIYATRRGNVLSLNFLKNKARNTTIKIETNKSFKIVANDKFIYLIFNDEIILISNKKTEIIKLSDLDIFTRSSLPVSIAVNKNNLFLGYNGGEWGGFLYGLSIGPNGNFTKNKDVSGNNIIGRNIDTLRLDSQENLWITSGSFHTSLSKSGLYKYKNKELITIIEQNGFSMSNKFEFKSTGDITLPLLRTINGMLLTADDNVVFVSPLVGILSINNSTDISYLWKGRLFFGYTEAETGIGSWPKGIVMMNNQIFIASRSLGVIEFTKSNSGKYAPTSQYVFK